MLIDPVAGIGLLRSLFETIVNTLPKIKGTPKQRFARELFELFDIFAEVEAESVYVISAIEGLKSDWAEEKWRFNNHAEVSILHLQRSCHVFLRWVDEHEKWKHALEIFAPETKEMLVRLEIQEDRVERFERGDDFEITKILFQLYLEFRHDWRHPKPIPQLERLNEILTEVEELLASVRQTKNLIREFAAVHLTIEDMF